MENTSVNQHQMFQPGTVRLMDIAAERCAMVSGPGVDGFGAVAEVSFMTFAIRNAPVVRLVF